MNNISRVASMIIVWLVSCSAYSETDLSDGINYNLSTGYYYFKATNKDPGKSFKEDFHEPIYKDFPWPEPSENDLRFALFVPQLVDTWKAQVYAVDAATKRLNIELDIYSAGGYVNLGKQIKQLREFGPNYDGILISAINSYKMNDVISDLGKQIPIVGYVNEVYSSGIHAKAMVYYSDLGSKMGQYLGNYIEALNLERPVNIAFVMGPKTAAWSEDMKSGVIDTLKSIDDLENRYRIVAQKHGHTKKLMQEKLVRVVLDQNENIDILVGTAPAIESAAKIRSDYQDRHPNLQLAAIYLNADLYPYFKNKEVMAVGSENLQDTGRLAVSMLLKLVYGEQIGVTQDSLPYRVSPFLEIYTENDIPNFPETSLFGPKNYEPKIADE